MLMRFPAHPLSAGGAGGTMRASDAGLAGWIGRNRAARRQAPRACAAAQPPARAGAGRRSVLLPGCSSLR